MKELIKKDNHVLTYDSSSGIAHHWFKGEQSKEDAEEVVVAMNQLYKKLGTPILMFVDARDGETVHAGARKIYAEFIESEALGRAAFVVSGVIMKTIVNMVFSVSGKKEKMQLFDTKEEAIAWLQT